MLPPYFVPPVIRAEPAELASIAEPSTDAAVKARMDPDEFAPADTNFENKEVLPDVERSPAQLRNLMSQGGEAEYLLDQVPIEMRGVLAARLIAAQGTDGPSFSETTASTLREQGYVVSEDVRGARLAAVPGKSINLSASDVVKIAADLDGGVQPRAKLPICSNCQAASPVGESQCQWCGEPFSDK